MKWLTQYYPGLIKAVIHIFLHVLYSQEDGASSIMFLKSFQPIVVVMQRKCYQLTSTICIKGPRWKIFFTTKSTKCELTLGL